MNIIQTNNLTKSFGKTQAVYNVTINVRCGEIYGFLGLNGAGKTTTIRLLLKMLAADSGSISLFGKEVKRASKIWNDIGYLVESPYSYPDLTVKENLEIYYRLRGMADKKRIEDVIDKLKLGKYSNIKAKYLSSGNNQRLGLAKALLHSPKLLILDEPISGLDPAGIVEVRGYLKDLVANHNTTIFLSSHILSEISKLATRIGIVHEGRLIKEIDANELDQQTSKKLIINTVNNEKALALLNGEGYLFILNKSNLIETNQLDAIQQPEVLATLLVNSNLPPKLLNVIEEDLESYFLRMIGE